MARAVLIIGLSWTLAGTAWGGGHCLDCHEAHYELDGDCMSCHGGDPAALRAKVAHHGMWRGAAAAWCGPNPAVTNRGAVLRDSLACRRCHISGGVGARRGVNLDAVVWRRSQADLRSALLHPAFAMPDFHLTEVQADTLIAVLLRDGNPHPTTASYQVYFNDAGRDSQSVFSRLCGECHQVLGRAGPEGRAGNAPNLSGLLGPYYPLDSSGPWTRERLERWLRNPRSERPGTTMPPVAVTEPEFGELIRLFSPGGAGQ